MYLFLWLMACDDGGKDVKDTGTGVDDSATDSQDDTGSTDDTGVTSGDVEIPLPDCTAAAGDADTIALSGVVVLPEGPVGGTVVYKPSTGKILCAGADCDTAGATVVCTEGIISPGLIDPHNHMQYNSLPPWQVAPEFEDRYEWQQDGRYYDYREGFDAISDSYTCEIMKWAEARQILHGATSAVGSSGGDCVRLLARNLDEGEEEHGLPGYYMEYSSGNVDNLNDGDADDMLSDLESGSLDVLVHHVAEGKDGSVRAEIDHMFDLGLSGPGNVYVHASDASTQQLARMGAEGTGIFWSPRSNLGLYAWTTPIAVAEALNVPWAIGTDWTPSGSMSELPELQCADEYLATQGSPVTRSELWEKGTSEAARLLNLDGVTGSLQAGLEADIAVFAWGSGIWGTLFSTGAGDVRLVIVDGKAIYGSAEWIDALADEPSWCESMDVCGVAKKFCLRAAESGDDGQTLAQVESILAGGLAGVTMGSGYEYAGELYPLYTCDPEPSCDISAPASGDDDGDGVPDSADLCGGVYDPAQWDEDGDGIGDFCDECPLVEGPCTPGESDIDGDGVLDADDNCVYDGNADQADGDGDLIGDACDACPDEANPGGTPCTVTIGQIADESRPDHVPDGTAVQVSGLVVTAVRAGNGFYVQDPASTTFGAAFVYDFGDNAVSLGDAVTVSGTYAEYYGLAEISNVTVTVTGTTPLPSPIDADTCSVATGGAQAEELEAMLIRVSGVAVTDSNADDDPDGSDAPDYNEYVVDGCLRINDALYVYTDQPAVGTEWSTITGILNWSFDNAKLEPRDADDLQP